MIIRCQGEDDIVIASDTLVGIDLSGVNLHSALLEGQDFSRARLVKTSLAMTIRARESTNSAMQEPPKAHFHFTPSLTFAIVVS